jgi:hypothetical protein
MLKQVVYTNSNCKDVWDMFVKENNIHTDIDLLFITDLNEFNGIPLENIYVYSNNEEYWSVWVNALNKFNIKNFIYLQEDFILYDYVNENKLIEITKILNNSDYSFIRLIKSGNLNNKLISDNLYEIESTNENIFSMQPTIWKTEDYIKIMNGVKEPKWFENYKYNNFMVQNNIKGLYYYNNEPKRGSNHYDSEIYPYIATALVKGKWNLSEYPLELGGLIKKYNININNRGVY